jgi:phage terminase large subunit-like protein
MPLDGAAWSTAVPDWETRILEGRSLLPDLPLFDGPAQKALAIHDRLRVPDLPGAPQRAEVAPDWVRDYIATVFGCYDPEKRRRMIQEFFLMIPKKNTKSDLAATIILIAAILNDRPKAELVLIAPSHNVAEIAFDQIAGMIALDPGPGRAGRAGQGRRSLPGANASETDYAQDDEGHDRDQERRRRYRDGVESGLCAGR